LELQRDLDRARAVARIEGGLHRLVLVTEDGDHAIGAGRARGLDDPADHRPAGDLVEDLRAVALHAGAEACGHDEDERRLTTHGAATIPPSIDGADGIRSPTAIRSAPVRVPPGM